MSNSIDTSALLTQLRSMAREAGVPAAGVPASSSSGPGVDGSRTSAVGVGGARGEGVGAARAGASATDVDFTDLLRRSIEGVNERSRTARTMTTAFESGRADVQLADVMIAVQKARVSFEALTQVRNKMVAAYKDIMSTPL